MSLSGKLRTLAATLRAPVQTLHQLQALQLSVDRLAQVVGTLAHARLVDRLPEDHLSRKGYSVYSQNDEDGIIAEIFRRIGRTNRFFGEIGVGDGMQCNTTHLLLQGWSGAWLEIDAGQTRRAENTFAREITAGRLRCINRRVTAENIESSLKEGSCPAEPDLVSIDVDGNDYWLWSALRTIRPRVLVIEYNAGFGPELEWVMQYDPHAAWDGSRRQGASLASLVRLGRAKGYRLVGCNLSGVNAFFVSENVAGSRFAASGEPNVHFAAPLYSPPSYAWPAFRGHPATPAEISGRDESAGGAPPTRKN